MMKTIDYAKNELKKYYKSVTGCDDVPIRLVVKKEGNEFDDLIDINVVKGEGEIKGSNERAVLIGVYKYFYELGCRFIRPGKDGEIIVKRDAGGCTVVKSYKPEYRYRGICSEGAISEENVKDMVEWLPKIGMNSYFVQFVDGHLFFEKWYAHKESSILKPEEYSVAESRKHYAAVVETIKRCGLIFQAVGHGWTTEPLGYITYGDTCSKEEDILPEHRELFAEVNGKRTFFESPGNTQLCYSNPKARDTITDGIVNYLKNNPQVDVLHFWLADSMNNHCECENCKKLLPSEWYVTMLTELDAKLTEAGINTKIVFLIYCDLLFAPQKVTIKNPNRFIMMYAPIARDFYHPLFTGENLKSANDAPEFAHNHNSHPKTPGQYLYYLKEWQKKVKCDSFVFDYHLMTFLYGNEPSGIRLSRTIYDDMKGLRLSGLNGEVSCQLQRTFIPTSLPNYVMAERLFGSERTFEQIEDENLSASFGKQWIKVKNFLHELENFYLSDCVKGKDERKKDPSQIAGFVKKIKSFANEIEFKDDNLTVNLSLYNLKYFVDLQIKFFETLLLKEEDKDIAENIKEINSFIDKNELSVQPFEDSLFRKDGLKTWL